MFREVSKGFDGFSEVLWVYFGEIWYLRRIMDGAFYISVILPLKLEWEPCYSLPAGMNGGDVTSGTQAKGSVKVGGIDVRNYDLQVLRDQVSMVLQKNVLFSGTVRENLLWGNENATQEEIEHACDLAQASPFINEMPEKYETYIEQGGSNVSGGQKQRLCIARALLKKPKVLILDDSTSAVDTKTDALIRKAFAEEIPDTTKIIIAQRIASIMTCDRIAVLDEGKLSDVGTHSELMERSEIYRDVYESQMREEDEQFAKS